MNHPEVISGFTYYIKTGFGHLYVIINEKDDKPYELFAILGKCGYDTNAIAEATGRLISIGFQHGIPIQHIYKQLEDIKGASFVHTKDGVVKSIPDGIAKAIFKYMKMRGISLEEKKEISNNNKLTIAMNKEMENIDSLYDTTFSEGLCPDCHSATIREGGCVKCSDPSCGWSKCG